MGGLPNTRGFDLLNLPGVAVQPNLTYSASTFDSAKILWVGCCHCWQVREILGVEEMEGGGRVTPSLGGDSQLPQPACVDGLKNESPISWKSYFLDT